MFSFGCAFSMGTGIRRLRDIFGAAESVSTISVIFLENKSQGTLVALLALLLEKLLKVINYY